MFEPGKNDGYYQLGLEAAAVIRQSIDDKGAVSQSTDVGSDTENMIFGGSPQADTSKDEARDLLL